MLPLASSRNDSIQAAQQMVLSLMCASFVKKKKKKSALWKKNFDILQKIMQNTKRFESFQKDEQ